MAFIKLSVSISLPNSSRVAPVRALNMLNEQLPHNLTQISFLKFFFCGAFNPLAINKSEIIFNQAYGWANQGGRATAIGRPPPQTLSHRRFVRDLMRLPYIVVFQTLLG